MQRQPRQTRREQRGTHPAQYHGGAKVFSLPAYRDRLRAKQRATRAKQLLEQFGAPVVEAVRDGKCDPVSQCGVIVLTGTTVNVYIRERNAVLVSPVRPVRAGCVNIAVYIDGENGGLFDVELPSETPQITG